MNNDAGTFWIYSTEIKNDVLNFNKSFTDDVFLSKSLTNLQSSNLKNDLREYYDLHLIYENTAFNALNYLYSNDASGFLSEYEDMKLLHSKLIDKLNHIEQTLQVIPTSSKLSITYLIDNFQTLQWILIILIGIVTLMLVSFLNKTNTNLKFEVKTQTQNLQKLNQKLRKIDKKRGEFIAIASHELKGPLQPIFGFIELSKTGIITKQEALDGISNVAFNLEQYCK